MAVSGSVTPEVGVGSSRASVEKANDATHFETSVLNSEFLANGNSDGLKRALPNRKVQLVAIGGSIGTALFLSIGGVLYRAGPANLFLGFLIYNIFLALANNCMAEMSTYMPVSGGFVRMAGHWVDDAFGFMVSN